MVLLLLCYTVTIPIDNSPSGMLGKCAVQTKLLVSVHTIKCLPTV